MPASDRGEMFSFSKTGRGQCRQTPGFQPLEAFAHSRFLKLDFIDTYLLSSGTTLIKVLCDLTHLLFSPTLNGRINGSPALALPKAEPR